MKVLWPLEFRSQVIDCYLMKAGSSSIFVSPHVKLRVWTVCACSLDQSKVLLKPLAHFQVLCLSFNSVFATPGWPIPHQSASDAHELLPVCHGHHDVLLRGHQRAARQSTANQRGLLPWEGTTVWRHAVGQPKHWLVGVTALTAVPSFAGGAVRGLENRRPRAMSELWHGLMYEKNTSCLLNLGNTIRDIRALWMHYFRNVGFLQPKIYKCLFPVV